MHPCLRLLLCLALLAPPAALSAERRIELTLQYQQMDLAGQPVRAVTVNGQLPGPLLRFTEGDTVEIVVHNRLDEPGAIHWHGLLVPWRMDGVPWVSMPPIASGESFTYRFPLRQSGTYWYHAHSGWHEQQGLYGAFIVDPRHEPVPADRDITVLFSDWSNTHPGTLYRNLKKDGDYYKRWRPSWDFFLRAWREAPDAASRAAVVAEGRAMQTMRMGSWDWSDVAYDRFLLNGQPPERPFHATIRPGERVRLRLINGGASTYFQVKLHGVDAFTVTSADGQAVQPVTASRLLMGMAETYDIEFTAPAGPVAIHAEALDRSGAAFGILSAGTGVAPALADIPPFNDPLFTTRPVDHAGHAATGASQGTHAHHGLPVAAVPGILEYRQLRSLAPTHDPDGTAETITLDLTGSMERYTWSFNDTHFRHAQPITFVAGQTYRFVLHNTTMMHHPIHIHGHWFILENGQGAHSPRKHTIDVPPMQTVTARVIAQESGNWFFHCHNLYHMMAGMTREIHYAGDVH